MGTKKKKNFFSRIVTLIKSLFLNGLFIILPLTLTAGLFAFTFRVFKSWLQPIRALIPDVIKIVPQVEFVLAIAIVFAIGALVKIFLLEPLIHWLENIFWKIPLVSPVYFGIKQLIGAFTNQRTMAFQKVALVEFPRPGMYCLGFLTSTVPEELAPEKGKAYYSFYVPTTPNPTTGYYVIVAETECIMTDLTRQEAMSTIISGGIIQPERFKKNTQK